MAYAPPPPTSAHLLALALLSTDGIGRVTAGRLLREVESYDELLRFPREQILTRLRGVPNASLLVEHLLDEPAMRERLAKAAGTIAGLGQRGVSLVTRRDPEWPGGLDALPRGSRPVVLYTYGTRRLLVQPLVAFLARAPLDGEAFERAQALVRHLAGLGIGVATGAASGFDVVAHKLTAMGLVRQPSALVASAGLSRIPPNMRPTVSLAVRAGGLVLSAFDMDHGPYEHDDRERALVQAALSSAVVAVDPRPETPEWEALSWALEAKRPVFAIPGETADLPERVHPVSSDVDFEWVAAAAGHLPPEHENPAGPAE